MFKINYCDLVSCFILKWLFSLGLSFFSTLIIVRPTLISTCVCSHCFPSVCTCPIQLYDYYLYRLVCLSVQCPVYRHVTCWWFLPWLSLLQWFSFPTFLNLEYSYCHPGLSPLSFCYFPFLYVACNFSCVLLLTASPLLFSFGFFIPYTMWNLHGLSLENRK